jgi:TPR repeat protein
MTVRDSSVWGARRALFCAVVLSAFSVQPVSAKETCPSGLWASEGTCCEPGSEYVASKNQCLPVRPERRCAQGHLDDCVVAARSLEQQGDVGEGYAVELYRFACEEGHAPGCRGLASLYNEGRGVARDAERAMALWEDACAQGDAPACTILAHLFAQQGAADTRVMTLLAMGCHRGDPAACSDYATGMSHSPGHESTVSSYFERACNGGVGRACRSLLASERSEKVVSPARERELLDRACRAQDDEACSQLSHALANGRGKPSHKQ